MKKGLDLRKMVPTENESRETLVRHILWLQENLELAERERDQWRRSSERAGEYGLVWKNRLEEVEKSLTNLLAEMRRKYHHAISTHNPMAHDWESFVRALEKLTTRGL